MSISKLLLALVVASCALLGAAGPTTASTAGLHVLVTGTCDFDADLADAIAAQPGIAGVTTWDNGSGTPTQDDFGAADLVVSLGDTCNSTQYNDAALYGDRLATYVDYGGVVLQAAYDNWDSDGAHPTGRWLSDGYAPLDLGPNDNSSTTLGTLLRPNSPILKGLGTFPTGDNTTTPLADGATLLAKWADDRNAIAVKGRVVATSASAAEAEVLPDMARLARNTAVYFNFVPSTRITRVIINSSARTAAFRYRAVGPYSALGFICYLKKAGGKPRVAQCPAHKKYSHLSPGSYTFQVDAVGPGGPDPTPAKKVFRISP